MNLKERRKCLIDVETTGFSYVKNQILEVGMLIIEDDEIIAEKEIKIKSNNDYEISEAALQSNNINLEEHNKVALDEADALDEMIEFLDKNLIDKDKSYIIIGQNVDFDINFLSRLFKKYSKSEEFKKYIGYRKLDIMQVALFQVQRGKIELESLALDSIIAALEIKMPKERHRALCDCKLEFETYKQLLYK